MDGDVAGFQEQLWRKGLIGLWECRPVDLDEVAYMGVRYPPQLIMIFDELDQK